MLKDVKRGIAGSLLYFDPDLSQWSLLDLSSRKSVVMNAPGIVSPDGEYMANIDYDTNTLRVVTQSKTVYLPIPDHVFLDGFLSDERIRLSIANIRKKNYVKDVGTTDEFYTLSTATGVTTFHSVFLPYYLSVMDSDLLVKYSPDLKYVIYPAKKEEKYEGILFDVERQKIVWQGETQSVSILPGAIWKADSNAVTIVYSQDNSKPWNLFNLHSDGKTIQLTHLEDDPSHSSLRGVPIWSPDGRYLAYRASDYRNDQLKILDSKTGIVIDPCLSLGDLIFSSYWAPDSTGFAIMPRGMTTIVIVDLVDQVIYEAYKQPGVDFVDPYAKPNQVLLDFRGWLSWELP
jgi:hypothetical protein